MKRSSQPQVSSQGEQAIHQYAHYLSNEQDLSADTCRNYLSDLRLFVAWCEASGSGGLENNPLFDPHTIAIPTITQYRAYLQTVLQLRPATINRHLISLKRYFSWAAEMGQLQRDPAKIVKLVPQVPKAPRHLTDQEESALLAAVTTYGSPRNRAIILLALHTGLRAEELCKLQKTHITLGKRSGHIIVHGKRNKYREVPLNSTVRTMLEEYLPTLSPDVPWLFISKKLGSTGNSKQHMPISERALGYLVAKYAALAKVVDLSPHDLRHRFGYRMSKTVPLHRLAQIMGHDSLDTTMIYVQATKQDLQQAVEEIAWE